MTEALKLVITDQERVDSQLKWFVPSFPVDPSPFNSWAGELVSGGPLDRSTAKDYYRLRWGRITDNMTITEAS